MQKLVETLPLEGLPLEALPLEGLQLETLPPQWREFYRLSREMAAEVRRIRQQDEKKIPTEAGLRKVATDEFGGTEQRST
jgi:hypothetical protein